MLKCFLCGGVGVGVRGVWVSLCVETDTDWTGCAPGLSAAALSSYSCACVKIRHCRRKKPKTKRAEGGVRHAERAEDLNANGMEPKEEQDRKAGDRSGKGMREIKGAAKTALHFDMGVSSLNLSCSYVLCAGSLHFYLYFYFTLSLKSPLSFSFLQFNQPPYLLLLSLCLSRCVEYFSIRYTFCYTSRLDILFKNKMLDGYIINIQNSKQHTNITCMEQHMKIT